ncbi:hypothetical protein [Endozoicomonas ascidiicola]|uniref:hypothetical protein n=2 Tax=Endozoicomonas ascidiicola TaxID=1698521 RepID=UPI000ABB7E09|nr:hypothetical protein [Endozoicomonas ascidiicola]
MVKSTGGSVPGLVRQTNTMATPDFQSTMRPFMRPFMRPLLVAVDESRFVGLTCSVTAENHRTGTYSTC